VWPITLPEAAAKPLELSEGTVADFGTVTAAALTSFFAIGLELRQGGRSASCTFVLNVPLMGAPEGRRAGIIRDVLSDEDSVKRFLFLMLSADLRSGDVSTIDGTLRGSKNGQSDTDGPQLLELLLQHLSRAPHRLDELSETIDALRASSDAARRLPDGFMTIWEPIWAARQGLRPRGAK
jgi:hypothetical protein